MDLLTTSSYDYDLPKEQIAQHLAKPADMAKLLVYKKSDKSIFHVHFFDLFKFLPKNTNILLNDTKVIKARIFGHKQSGGQIEIMLNSSIGEGIFKAYIRGKVKPDTQIILNDEVCVKVLSLFDDGLREIAFYKFNKLLNTSEIYEFLQIYGHVPLPPYIKRKDEKEDEINYQTLFATHSGAVAAPTASLHFTPEMFEKLKNTYKHAYLTLHVGAGTFKPVESENILSHHMHEEFFSISNQAQEIINSDEKLLAIGTTVTRVVEDFVRNHEAKGACKLFLNPSNPPQRVDMLLTNFHLPRSTLLMLVASFIGLEQTLRVYEIAIKNGYRFYSYGDAMLIID